MPMHQRSHGQPSFADLTLVDLGGPRTTATLGRLDGSVTREWDAVMGHPQLAKHVANGLVADEFDMSYFQGKGLDHGFFSPLSDNTNVLYLMDPAYCSMGGYTRAAGLYKCPADKSWVMIDGQRHNRVRSYSMNDYLGVWVGPLGFGDFWRARRQISQFVSPPPCDTSFLSASIQTRFRTERL